MTNVAEVLETPLPKQARSRARRAALIEHGVGLLERCEPDEFSIAEITEALGYSTGSFYSYFADKEAYFIAIQEWVNAELEDDFNRTFASERLANADPVARLAACVNFAIAYFRRRTGVIRSALRYERRIPQGWAPNRDRTRRIVEAATNGLPDNDKERLEFALQLAFGLLVNALLHDPGPLRLNDKDLGLRIVGALGQFLEHGSLPAIDGGQRGST